MCVIKLLTIIFHFSSENAEIFSELRTSPLLTTTSPALKPRITCIIFTEPQQYKKSVIYVNQTWAGRCDNFAFYSHDVTGYSNTVGAVEFRLEERRLTSWLKLVLSFQHAWNHFHNSTDWFFVSDDRK